MVGIVRDAQKSTTAIARLRARATAWSGRSRSTPATQAALDFATRGQPETFAISPDGGSSRRRSTGRCRRRRASRRCSRAARGQRMIRRWWPWIALGGRRGRSCWSIAALAERRADATRRARTTSRPSCECPECEGLSVADSNAPTSRAIRADIKRRIADGQSDAEIRQAYVDKYGESILLAPQSSGLGLIVWVLPGRWCSCSAPPASCSRSRRDRRRAAAPRDRGRRAARGTGAGDDSTASIDRSSTPTRSRSATSSCGRSTTSSSSTRAAGIDDESYAELHDDYTARAAATIRALRDGVDVTARAPPPRAGPAPALVIIVGGRGVRAAWPAWRSRARSVPASRARPRRATRRRRRTTTRPRSALGSAIKTLEAKVNASPTTTTCACSSRARTRQNGDLRQRAQAVRRRDHASTPTARGARERGPAALPRVGAGRRQGHAGAARGRGAAPGSTRRSRSDPTTPTRTTSARCSTLATDRLRPRRRSTSRRTSCKAPTGQWADTRARSCCAQVTTALESTVDYRADSPDRRPSNEEAVDHGAAPRVRDRRQQDLPGDDHHRPRHDGRSTSTRSSRRTP